MKRYLLSLFFMLLLALTASAKINIPLVKSVPPGSGSGGDVRGGTGSNTYGPIAYFHSESLYIQTPTITDFTIIITNDSTGVEVINSSYEKRSWESFGISHFKLSTYTIYIIVHGDCWIGHFDLNYVLKHESENGTLSFGLNCGAKERNYGSFMIVGNASQGWNYGVSGILMEQSEGTGIYGSSRNDEGFNTNGRFAGLFHGDLKITDAVFASAYNTLADSRLNDDMKPLEFGNLENLMQLNVYSYGLKQFNVDSGDETSTLDYYNDDSGILEKEHFGLSGQEIEKIYPNLVSESRDGYLSVNYIEMIPLLIQSIQELKLELDRTKDQLEELKTEYKVANRSTESSAVLYQNTPNPFLENCVVKCSIPQDAVTATLYLYDVNGRQIDSVIIKDRGDVSIVIDDTLFDAAIYFYSLVVNGEVVDTKRMIHIE